MKLNIGTAAALDMASVYAGKAYLGSRRSPSRRSRTIRTSRQSSKSRRSSSYRSSRLRATTKISTYQPRDLAPSSPAVVTSHRGCGGAGGFGGGRRGGRVGFGRGGAGAVLRRSQPSRFWRDPRPLMCRTPSVRRSWG